MEESTAADPGEEERDLEEEFPSPTPQPGINILTSVITWTKPLLLTVFLTILFGVVSRLAAFGLWILMIHETTWWNCSIYWCWACTGTSLGILLLTVWRIGQQQTPRN